MLESVAKYVLRELDYPIRENSGFAELWHHARDRLGLLPESVTDAEDGGKAMKTILGSAWRIAEQVNTLRKTDGTGHGRALISGVTPEAAQLVVREAVSIARFRRSVEHRRPMEAPTSMERRAWADDARVP